MARDDGAGAGAAGRAGGRSLRDVLPRSALGLAGLLFAMSVASAATGAILYAYYEYRLGQTDDRVEEFAAGFEETMDEAVGRIQAERDTAVGAVQGQLDDLERFAASGETLTALLEQAAPSVWFVSTLDEAGQPSVGSAFVVFSDSEQSFLLASYTTVRAATQNPAPEITVRKGDDVLGVELTAWDPANDLALLTVDRPSLPALEWAPPDPPTQVGDRVFVVSGLGARASWPTCRPTASSTTPRSGWPSRAARSSPRAGRCWRWPAGPTHPSASPRRRCSSGCRSGRRAPRCCAARIRRPSRADRGDHTGGA